METRGFVIGGMKGTWQNPAVSLAWPQLDSHAMSDELQGVGALIIELRLEEPRFHHLDKKALDPCVAHGPDAERQRVARIDNTVFLHLSDRIGKLTVADVGIVALDESIGR